MSERSTASRSSVAPWLQNREMIYLLVLLSQLPSLLGYLRRIWSSGHYQFAVILIPLVAWMMKERLVGIRTYRPGNASTLLVLFAGLIFTMMLATFVAPMFWILSFMALSFCYVYDRYGNQGIKAVAPIWLILLVVVPLPRGLDNLLVTKLQAVASEFASWILDAIGFVHFRNGVVLVTEKDQFFTEEACSGIRSLFSSLGAIALYCVHKKYGIARSLFNLVQTLFWVLVGNAARIAIVVWVSDNWTSAIATGWQHDLLGLATFLSILLLVVSTDRILKVILEMWWPKENAENFEDPVLETVVVPGKATTPRTKLWVCLAIASVFLAFCGFRLMTSKDQGHLRNPLFAMPDFPVSEASDLPVEIDGWKQKTFEPVYRGEDVILAAQSYTWRYEKEGVEVIVSIDGPWEFWHDITACYRGIGWTTSTTHGFSRESESANVQNRSRIDLSKVTGEKGVVFFAQHDLTGRVVKPSMLGGVVSLELIKLNALDNIRTIFGIESKLDAGFRQYKLPLSTIQVFCQNSQTLSEAQIQSVDAFYDRIREAAVNSKRFSLAASDSSSN